MTGKPSLITVTHDPGGKNLALFQTYHRILCNIYSNVYLTVSEETSPEFIKEIQLSKVKHRVITKKGVAEARREVLRLALEENSKSFHYCDLDRVLTWISSYPEELKRVVSSLSTYDYLIIGRTERAMSTHPMEWVKTEEITNKIFSLELGKKADITAGSCTFSRNCAVLIERYSRALMTDAEWPMIAKRIGDFQIDYVEVEGLQYHETVNGVAEGISDADRWFNRLRLSYIISDSARNTGK